MSAMVPAANVAVVAKAASPATTHAPTVQPGAANAAATTAASPTVAPAAQPTTTAANATTAAPVAQSAVDMPAPAAADSTAAPASTQKPVAGVTFPVRPATTATTQSPSNAVGHASAADADSIGGALFSLVLVVGLILALGWLAKRMPGLQRGAGSSQLKVVASVALGPRDRAVVVDVGGTQLLVGVGQGGVRTLHTLERPLPVAEAPNTPSPFAQILAQHFGKKP